ncbi:MAG TPA: DUF3800 domain-containing protein [Methylocella sp.]|nr:DUF3800 domain-containing protein [Methylocella sp.]
MGEPPSSIIILSLALSYLRRLDLQFMVMTAFFDESGTHGRESPATVFGGFAATELQWAKFEESLKELMAHHGIKSIHAKDFRQRRGDFSGMPFEQYSQFNSSFLQLIDNNLSSGFVIILSSCHYKEIYKPRFFKKKKCRPDSEYGLCFRAILWRALMFMKENETQGPLVPILELGHRNCRDASRIYNEIKQRLTDEDSGLLGAIAFEEKKRCLPLAVADSLVYAAFRKTAGYTSHARPNTFPVGPSVPPYYVSKIPVTRIELDGNILDYLSSNLGGADL